MNDLTPKNLALLSNMKDAAINISEAMRSGGYASRSAARKGLRKLCDLGFVDGEFGEAPVGGTPTKNGRFFITKEGRAHLSSRGVTSGPEFKMEREQ